MPKPLAGLGLIRSETVSNEELYTTVNSGSYLSREYLAFSVVGALIAGLGLATDNSTVVVSSMLISVLMNPILAAIIGTLIREKEMTRRGVLGELIGILLSVGVGALIGLVYWLTDDPYDWPTGEMLNRGELKAMIAGTAVAIPSGVGVGYSVSAGGVNALVGVAIAASLLPPLVNVGISLTYGLLIDEEEFIDIAGYSAAIFVINVVVIYTTGLLVFRSKGVSPLRRQLHSWRRLPKPVFPETDEIELEDPSLSDSVSMAAVFEAPLSTPRLPTRDTHRYSEREIVEILTLHPELKSLFRAFFHRARRVIRDRPYTRYLSQNRPVRETLDQLVPHVREFLERRRVARLLRSPTTRFWLREFLRRWKKLRV